MKKGVLLLFLLILPSVSAYTAFVESSILTIDGSNYKGEIPIYRQDNNVPAALIELTCKQCNGKNLYNLNNLNLALDKDYYFYVCDYINQGKCEKFNFDFGRNINEECNLDEDCIPGLHCVGPGPKYGCCPIDKECYLNNKCYDIGEFTPDGKYVCSNLNTFETCNDYCSEQGMKCVDGKCVVANGSCTKSDDSTLMPQGYKCCINGSTMNGIIVSYSSSKTADFTKNWVGPTIQTCVNSNCYLVMGYFPEGHPRQYNYRKINDIKCEKSTNYCDGRVWPTRLNIQYVNVPVCQKIKAGTCQEDTTTGDFIAPAFENIDSDVRCINGTCVNGKCVKEITEKIKCDYGCTDLNGDGIVNDEDIYLFKTKYPFSSVGDSKYDPIADFNGDGSINQEEINCLGLLYGKNLDCNKISLTIATLKDVYTVNEEIKLTDPPDVNGVIVYSANDLNNLYSTDENAYSLRQINQQGIYNSNMMDSQNLFEMLKSNGYIIQFEEEPIIVKKTELDKIKTENAKYIEQHPILGVAKRAISINTEEEVEKEIEKQNILLEKEHQELKLDIYNKISETKITGNFVKTIVGMITKEQKIRKNDNLIFGEYKIAFNGVALNISEEQAKEIEKIRGVKKIYPNYIVNITLMDSVPLIQGGIKAGKLDINGNNCEETGNECLTGKGITIAVIDTGVDYTHPDLGGCIGENCKLIGGYDFVNTIDINKDGDFDDCYIRDINGNYCENFFWVDKNNDGDFDDCYTVSVNGNICEEDNDPIDDHGHGTHVAATVAGNGALKGVAPDAKILAYKVLNKYGSGYENWIIAGIERAVDPNQDGDFSDKADIISMSLGGSGNPDDPMSQAVDAAVDAGIVAVIAAGNSGPDEETIGSPGVAKKAITVGAVDKNDNIAYFSSMGPVVWEGEDGNTKYLVKPDVVAPGVNICAAEYDSAWEDRKCFDEQHVAISGTSMATPHVAGAVALIRQAHPDWTPEEIKMALRNNAVNLPGLDVLRQGGGRINVKKAVNSEKPCVSKLDTYGEIAGSVGISGTAYCDNLNKYELYYQYDYDKYSSDSEWELLCSSSNKNIINDNLCSFDSLNFNDGLYKLKLVVIDSNGYSSDAVSIIEINNFEITNIGDAFNYLNGIEEINGVIKTPGYSAFEIDYKKSESNEDWIKLCSKERDNKEVFCEIDANSLDNGKYNFRLSILKDKAWLRDKPFKAAVIKELMDNWPVEISCSPLTQLVSTDLDGDAKLIHVSASECGQGWGDGFNAYLFNSDRSYKKISEFYKNGNSIAAYFYNPSSIIDGQMAWINSNFAGIIDKNGNLQNNWPYYFKGSDISSFTIVNENLFTLRESDNELFLYGFDHSCRKETHTDFSL